MRIVRMGGFSGRIPFGAAITTVLVLLMWGVPYGAEEDYFQHQQINIPGAVLGCRTADFNGDGMTDIIVLVAEPSGRRVLKSYLQREAGRFPPSASQTLELSPSVNAAQCIDLDGDGRAELLVVDRDGLWQYTHDEQEFAEDAKRLVSMRTLFASGFEDGLLEQSFMVTVSNRLTAFLPVLDGYSLWVYSQGKFREAGVIRSPHICSLGDRPVKLFGGTGGNLQGQYTIRIPVVVVGDDNGDDRDDVYLIWSDRLAIFHQTAGGSFDNENMSAFRFQETADDNFCQARLIDYDRDGRLDVVCSRSVGGISGALTEINFFHSTQIRRRDVNQSHQVVLTDACGNLMIGDFNGAGGLELVIPAVELGIMSTVKKMVMKKTDFHILIYPIDNLGRPAREPQVRKKISCRLDFEKADPTADIRINWSGDYDGDGLPDMVVADGGGQLLFYRGNVEDYLESKSNLVLDMQDPDEIKPVYLNGDRFSDLIIVHKQGEGGTRLTLLVTNLIG